MRGNGRTNAVWAVLAVGVLALGACEEDPVRQLEPEPEGYAVATTGDQLVLNLERSWEERNLPEFDGMIHDDFEFQFASEDIDASGTALGVWDRAREMAAVEAIFSGRPGILDAGTGNRQSPVEGIQMDILRRGDWRTDAPAQLNAQIWAEFDVDASFSLANGDVAEVSGRHRLFLAQVPRDEDVVYQVRRWEDEGNILKVETATWGGVKASY